MAETTKIEWCDATLNPWIGCTKVSPACANCYAERDQDIRHGRAAWGDSGTRSVTTPANWRKPIAWDKKAAADGVRLKVFCASLADVFEDWQGTMLDHKGNDTCKTMDNYRRELFKLIDQTPNLEWLLLTKRAQNILAMWPDDQYRPNIWLGTSIENQHWTDQRLPYLHEAKRRRLCGRTFVSAEPIVGPISLQGHLYSGGIDWVIAGGESGPGARVADPNWYMKLRDECEKYRTPFLFKQWGEWNEHGERVGKVAAGRILDYQTHDGYPTTAVEQCPECKSFDVDRLHRGGFNGGPEYYFTMCNECGHEFNEG